MFLVTEKRGFASVVIIFAFRYIVRGPVVSSALNRSGPMVYVLDNKDEKFKNIFLVFSLRVGPGGSDHSAE